MIHQQIRLRVTAAFVRLGNYPKPDSGRGRYCRLAVLAAGLSVSLAAQTLEFQNMPPKLPRDLGLGQYSPPVEIAYSGLATGTYQLKVWLLTPSGWYHASNQWSPRIIPIDNSTGANPAGKIVVVENMDVFGYDRFDWVARLYDPTGTSQLAFAEHPADATTNRPPVLNAIGNRAIARGNTLSFTVSANDESGPVTLSAANLPGGALFNAATGAFSWTPTADGVFSGIRFMATDSGDGPLTDAEDITISVTDKPVFTVQPQPLILTSGQSGSLGATATAAAAGGNISYQWFKDGVALAGKISSTLALQAVTRADAGTYHLEATNTPGTSASIHAFVIVATPRSNNETRSRLLDYLRGAQDQYHQTVDVYRDADSAGNHFHARGYIPGPTATVTGMGDSTEWPYAGATCMKFTFTNSGQTGGGIYLLNGTLIAGSPQPYFGESALTVGGTAYSFVDTPQVDGQTKRSFRGLNLAGATKLVFHARGAAGGEKIEFFMGGVGRGTGSQPYPDSCQRRPAAGVRTVLTTNWTRYEIDLAGLDLSDIKGGFGWYAESLHNPTPETVFYVDDVYYELSPEARAARLAQPRFMRSFTTLPVQPAWDPNDPAQPLPFDLAFRSTLSIYDQVVALFAFMAEGTQDGLRRARIIADALVYAHHHHRDPYLPGTSTPRGYSKFYKAGDIGLPPGWEIDGRAATVPAAGVYHDASQSYLELQESNTIDTGENLWCVLGLLAVYEATREPSYLQTAITVARAVRGHKATTGTYQGFTGGYERINSPGQTKRSYRSLEHNVDAVAAFRRLYQSTGDASWLADANHALVFVEQMWQPAGGCYLTGTSGDPNPQPNTAAGQLPQDAQSWTMLALAELPALHPQLLQSVELHHKVGIGGYDAFDFNDDRDGFWPEAQGHIATAYFRTANRARCAQLLTLLPKLQQMPPPYGDGNGIVAASRDCLTSGFDFNWFRRMHVGATAWAYMAMQRYNPFAAASMLPPAVVAISRPVPGAVRLDIAGEAGEFYRIDTGTDLIQWTPLETFQSPTQNTIRTYPITPGDPKRFYRVLHLPDGG